MTNVLRRTVLFSAATGAASVLFSTKASAVEKQYDPDIFAIEARMMRLSNRGSSLTESENTGFSSLRVRHKDLGMRPQKLRRKLL